MSTTIGMWEMVSELLEGEKLPVSVNEALEGLCNGDLVIAERHEFSKLEAENHALKTQVELQRKSVELTDEEILEIASPMFEDARYPSTALDFARAILRKAQEK